MNSFQVLWSRVQYLLSLVAVIGVLVYLVQHSHTPSIAISTDAGREMAVHVVGSKQIVIVPDSPLAKKLQVAKVETTEISTPLVVVTGVVAASLRPGNGKGNDYWQFNSSALLTAYTDWQIAVTETAFLEQQLIDTKQLAEAQTEAAQKLVERMQRLVNVGTDTEKDLAEAQSQLVQAQIQGRKDVHEAQAAIRVAQKTETVLARQLEQEGLEPQMLVSSGHDTDIIVADVPESWVRQIAVGQSCEAKFLSLPNQEFVGNVHAIVPVLSSERRSLRVLISLQDPDDKLRPGMFAEIGLGTDPRKALLVPSAAIIHIGRTDYILVQENNEAWRVAEVKVGETRNDAVEILDGLQNGDSVAGRGAILLKPTMMKSLQMKETKNN
ncbi:MAG: efflux RND transporter periplasmic adaptor subunit [Planctomycetaceae bacterium]|nr:efflux RND transporter periplasmic adaptor subunit [Planctomycetaceae bacterium]